MSTEFRNKRFATDGCAASPGGSTTVHRAIDRLTVALLELQRLRHRAAVSPFVFDGLTEEMRRVEHELEALGALLLEIRDTSD